MFTAVLNILRRAWDNNPLPWVPGATTSEPPSETSGAQMEFCGDMEAPME